MVPILIQGLSSLLSLGFGYNNDPEIADMVFYGEKHDGAHWCYERRVAGELINGSSFKNFKPFDNHKDALKLAVEGLNLETDKQYTVKHFKTFYKHSEPKAFA